LKSRRTSQEPQGRDVQGHASTHTKQKRTKPKKKKKQKTARPRSSGTPAIQAQNPTKKHLALEPSRGEREKKKSYAG